MKSPASRTGVAAQSGAEPRSPAAERPSHPLVSVCMPAYKAERFVGEALSSVLGQTYRNIQVFVLDNGSPDRTYEAARSVADERVSCIHLSENLGGFQGMNHLARMAQGEFIAIYHADDHYEPEIIAKEVAYLQAHPEVGAVFSLDHYMDDEGRIFGGSDLPQVFVGKESLGYEDVFPFLVRNKNILFCCPTFMVRRKVLEAVGPFAPEKWDIAADLEMWLRISRRFPVAILNERLMRYRIGKSQWSTRHNHLRTTPDWTFPVLEHYLEKDGWLPKLTSADLVEYAFHRCDDDTFRAANMVIKGDVRGARKLLERRYPWGTLRNGIRRRKLRLIVLRALIFTGLALRLKRPLVALLKRIGR